MSHLDLETLLSPLSADSPCGVDPEYDPALHALLVASAGKPEQQYGDTVIPAQPPDWVAVHEHALELAQRTRDLRVAVWLARSGARVAGFPGVVDGLRLLHGLVERYWGSVHPQLDASEGNDPTARVNALLPLVHPGAGLADIRAATLTGQRGGMKVRDIELAFGPAEPLPGEALTSADGVVQAVAAAASEVPELLPQMRAGHEAVQALAGALEQRLEASQSPEFAPLKKLLQRVAEAAQRVANGSAGADAATSGDPVAHVAAGSIASRDDAIRALDRVCEWIERNEPSNPAPLLIRRSQRLMSKSFIDIIRDLVPDGVRDVEKLAGIGNS